MGPSNVSSVVDYFSTHSEGFTTTLGSTISSAATTVPLSTTTNLTNGTVFVGIIEPGAVNQQVFTGTVNTGSGTITGVVWTRGTNVGHAGGVAIVDYVTGTAFNMLSAGILKQHTQTGAHTGVTTDTLAATGAVTVSSTGSIAVNTNKFTVAGSSGNTAIAGTLGVTGEISSTGINMSGVTGIIGTGLGAAVTTLNNAGSAGGTSYYMNMGGLKMLWGSSGGVAAGTGGSFTVALPTSFFTTIQMSVASPISSSGGAGGTNSAVIGAGASATTTTLTIEVTVPAGSSTNTPLSWFVIGT